MLYRTTHLGFVQSVIFKVTERLKSAQQAHAALIDCEKNKESLEIFLKELLFLLSQKSY